MTRSLAFVLIAALAAAGVASAVYGAHAGTSVLQIFVPLGAATALAAHWIAGRRAKLGGLRRQLAALAVIATVQLAAAVVLFVELMFVSRHDALFAVLVAAYTGLLGLWAAHLIGRRALDDLDKVRATLDAVGDGRRDLATGLSGRDELARLGRDVDAMIARLSTEERARRALMAAASHDLRTPITSLQLLTAAIDDELVTDPETRRDYLARMTTHIHALSSLIDDLFELSRLESGDIRWTMERVRLDELVAETVDAMRPQAEACSVVVRAELDPGLTAAHVNPEQIQRVLFNLIQNAIRHTPADGSVVVRAQPATAGRLEIEVADTGEGIAVEHRGHVFDAFFQADAARSDGGAGLGLAIARAIVEAHGGHIWLDDAPVGTRVRFSLPVAA